MRGNETPYPIWMKFCRMVDIYDVIKYVNFGDGRLRSLGVAGGQIMAFPIDFDRRPYNTLALPCECVSAYAFFSFSSLGFYHADNSLECTTNEQEMIRLLEAVLTASASTSLSPSCQLHSCSVKRLNEPSFLNGTCSQPVSYRTVVGAWFACSVSVTSEQRVSAY